MSLRPSSLVFYGLAAIAFWSAGVSALGLQHGHPGSPTPLFTVGGILVMFGLIQQFRR